MNNTIKSNVNTTDKFIDDLFEISNKSLPDSAIWHAKLRLLDYLGVAFAGSKMLKDKVSILINNLGDSGNSTVIGSKIKTTKANAALINGICSHVAELDDGERFAMMHPGSPIISALLPVVEEHKLTGDDFIRGIVLGYESSIRLARAIQPALKDRGYHATGVCGTIGAAIAISSALNFNKEQMKAALAAAATSAAGILEVIDEGSQLKPYNSANAALSGLVSAFMGKAGFDGPKDVIAGRRGLLAVHTDRYDLSLIERKENDYLRVENAYVKPYAACRHCHPAIEGVQNILKDNKIENNNIKTIRVATYYWAVGGHDQIEVDNVSVAKMSTPFSVAVTLCTGKAGLYEFMQEKINDPNIQTLISKVSVVTDNELTDLFPGKRAAIVEIEMNDGLVLKNRVDIPKGEPENPLTEIELKDKFFELSLFSGKQEVEIENIFDVVMDIENKIDNLYKFI